MNDRPFTQGPFAGLGASWNSFAPPHDFIESHDTGAAGGGEAGCDYQILSPGSTLVVGIVTDITALDASSTDASSMSTDTSASFDIRFIGSIRGRLGLGTETWLAYITGGYAYADVDTRAFDVDGSNIGVMDVSSGGTESGWVIGGGLEHRLMSAWSLSIEYLHYEFDGVVATGPATSPPGAFPRFDTDLDIDVVRIGAKWRP